MSKTKISEYSATANSNTDVGGINIDEGCAPSGINDAIRTLMAQLKNFQTGASGDSFNGPVGTTTAAAGAFTTLSASGVATFSAGSASAPALTTSGDTNTGVLFPAADTVGITTGGTERVRVDSSGNVGIGVSPSAWGGSYKALQVNKGSVSNVGGTVYFGANFYHNGTNSTYITTDYASLYGMADGQHRWYYAPSGTAGNAISFTQAMTLDASGNLVLNDTSRIGSARFSMTVNPSTENVFAFKTSTNGAITALRGLSSDGNEQAAIDFNTSSQYMAFRTANAERARIDSSGQVLIGTTTASSTYGLRISSTRGINLIGWGNGRGEAMQLTAHNTSNADVIYFDTSAANVGKIAITSTATSYVTSSDYRLKENIAPMTGALAKVATLKPCTYTWKSNGEAGEGFIAHELQEVVPHAVTGEKDEVKEDGTPLYQGIDTSFLVATLTAAIQEQQAIITQLQADVAALKGQ